MATRKDLIKAHKFTADRLVAALVDRDPDRLDSPLRRVGMAFFASVMVGVLVTAGFGVVGVIQGGGNASAWKESESAVVVDSQAGQVFWYTRGQLWPMENFTSARLAAGDGAEIVSLKTDSLRGTPRGTPLGIVGAPRTLPGTGDLGLYPIRVCAAAPEGDDEERLISLEYGRPVPSAAATPVVLVDDGGRGFLVVEGLAHPLPGDPGDTPLLAVQQGYPVVTGAEALLDSLPLASALSAEQLLREVPDVGRPAPNPVGEARTIGTLVTVGGGASHFILVDDGFARLQPLEFEALRAELSLPVVELPTADVVESDLQIGESDVPSVMPAMPPLPDLAGQSFCATWTDGRTPPQLTAGAPTPDPTASDRRSDDGLADVVVAEPGHGALVHSAAAAGEPTTGTLITEGLQYGIAGPGELAALGYGGATIEPISPQLLALIPPGLSDGRRLTTDDAQRPPVTDN